MAETDLYIPVKRFLELQGYTVKAEIKSCDVVAVRGDEPPVIVELKAGLTLQLVYQAIDRLSVTPFVYIAIARPKRAVAAEAIKLCKRIGAGLAVVSASGSVEILADPLPYVPRINSKRKGQLLREFAKRKGDPNLGGSRAMPIMTAYKQDAILLAEHLSTHGPARVRDLKSATGVDRTANILRDNHYGWFKRVERGVYELTETGRVPFLRGPVEIFHEPTAG
jgi:hypothetical protein